MQKKAKPLVISSPEPRSLDLIFTPEKKALLFDNYSVLEVEEDEIAKLDTKTLASTRYILGQPPLSLQTLEVMSSLKCIFNVESNLLNNMPYDYLFQQGIYVLTTGAVFATPVAELGLAMALNLARNVVEADAAFNAGSEIWGYASNQSACLLTGSNIGIIGFGDLGHALAKLLVGFQAHVRVFDPWLPESMLLEQGVTPASLDQVLTTSDTLFVVASVTSENKHFLDKHAFAKMKKGCAFILLSRAEVVNFDDLLSSVSSGHLLAASDVFPEEPLSPDHPVRNAKGFIRSAHRAGALDCAFKKMGDMVLEDMVLLDKDLPPKRCKRAERETVALMQSKPVNIN
ncbi:MAG: hydroxyacid dehydrogenase [Granulosicoccus sp.]